MDLLGEDGIRAFQIQGHVERVEVETYEVAGQDFQQAIRAKVKVASTNPWDVQLQACTTKAIAAGDVILVTFHFRAEWSPQESGEGETELVVELAHDPWTKAKAETVRGAYAWRKIQVPFTAAQSFAAGAAQIIFRLGFARETIDIGGVTVENFGRRVLLADLPATRNTYTGIGEGATWRAAAHERIEKLRKADMIVVVKDSAGRPLPGARIAVSQKKHAFAFGTAVPAGRLVEPGNEKYQQILLESFNTATLENDLKWVPLAGDWGPSFTIERAQRALDWLKAHGLDVRGHALVWPGWQNLPSSLRRWRRNPNRLRAEIEKHIRDVVAAMRGRLIHWDVLNEPFDNHDLLDILGKEVAVDWFALARATDPAPKLFINDYAILSGGGGTSAHRDHYERTIQMLVDGGACFDGIGMQGHFGATLTAPEDMLAIVDRFAKFGKTIWITEYDVVIDDEELAGQFTRDLYTALFSHPAVGGIVMWGFWDADHWKNNSALYRKDWSLKPSGQAYRDLVLATWHTDVRGETDQQGRHALRGFLGEYDIAVQVGAKSKTVGAALPASGLEIEIRM